jgi:hypothetical protein
MDDLEILFSAWHSDQLDLRNFCKLSKFSDVFSLLVALRFKLLQRMGEDMFSL